MSALRDPLPLVANWFARLEAGAMRRARLRPGFCRIAWLQVASVGAWQAQSLLLQRRRLEWQAREPGCGGQMLARPERSDRPSTGQLRRLAMWKISGFSVRVDELRDSAGKARRIRRCATLARRMLQRHAK